MQVPALVPSAGSLQKSPAAHASLKSYVEVNGEVSSGRQALPSGRSALQTPPSPVLQYVPAAQCPIPPASGDGSDLRKQRSGSVHFKKPEPDG